MSHVESVGKHVSLPKSDGLFLPSQKSVSPMKNSQKPLKEKECKIILCIQHHVLKKK